MVYAIIDGRCHNGGTAVFYSEEAAKEWLQIHNKEYSNEATVKEFPHIKRVKPYMYEIRQQFLKGKRHG